MSFSPKLQERIIVSIDKINEARMYIYPGKIELLFWERIAGQLQKQHCCISFCLMLLQI